MNGFVRNAVLVSSSSGSACRAAVGRDSTACGGSSSRAPSSTFLDLGRTLWFEQMRQMGTMGVRVVTHKCSVHGVIEEESLG